jgi:hypothetical protein
LAFPSKTNLCSLKLQRFSLVVVFFGNIPQETLIFQSLNNNRENLGRKYDDQTAQRKKIGRNVKIRIQARKVGENNVCRTGPAEGGERSSKMWKKSSFGT